MNMSVDPQDLAEELWKLLQSGSRSAIAEQDTTLVGELRDSLGLPKPPRAETPIAIPARTPGATVVLEAPDKHYVVRPGIAAELPVEIDTRRGTLVVDPDDPLARVRRSIESLDAMKF